MSTRQLSPQLNIFKNSQFNQSYALDFLSTFSSCDFSRKDHIIPFTKQDSKTLLVVLLSFQNFFKQSHFNVLFNRIPRELLFKNTYNNQEYLCCPQVSRYEKDMVINFENAEVHKVKVTPTEYSIQNSQN